jgi:hypothetical protein
MDAIDGHDAVVGKQGTLAPCFKLFSQCLVASAHGAGGGANSPQLFSDCSDLRSPSPTHQHLGQGFRYLGGIAVLPLERLRVKLPFPISGDLEILNASGGSAQVTSVGPLAISPAIGCAFSP